MGVGNEKYKLPNPQWNGTLRSCVICSVKDHPVYAHETNDDGSPKFWHKVTIDMVFVNPTYVLTDKDRKLKYELMTLEGTRKAKVRAICRECLDLYEETREVWQDFDKARKEADEDNHMGNYYSALCSE